MHQHLRFSLYALALLAILGLASCEEILDADGLPYEEKLVVHSILFADSVNTIQITKTLPLNIPFDTNQAYLKDATGSISDGTTSYPLSYVGYGGKYVATGLKPQVGMQYELRVSWHDLKAQATTVIPQAAEIDSAWLQATFTPWGSEFVDLVELVKLPAGTSVRIGYGAIFDEIFGGPSYTSGTGYGVFRRADSSGLVQARMDLWTGSGLNDFNSFTAKAYVFAPGYYEYFESKNTDSDETLGNPVMVKWNVSGDAIGIFFGCSIVEKKIK